MRIVTLLENDSLRNDLKSAHGLSLYIEHNHKKILFDIGPGNQYIKNAKKLGGIKQKIALIGDSSGGNLSAAICLKNNDAENTVPLVMQVLISALHCLHFHYLNRRYACLSLKSNYHIRARNWLSLEIVAKITNIH